MSFEAIHSLIHRYADAVCRRDQSQWGATWAPDASWELPGRPVTGQAAIVELWAKAMGMFAQVVQVAHNGEVSIDEEAGTGRGRWYISEHFRRANGAPGILLAWYDDTYVRLADGQWAFMSRRLTPLYQGSPDLSADFIDASAQAGPYA